MKVLWTPEARADRHAIYDYIETDNPAAALDVDGLFTKGAAQLAMHPMTGRAGRVDGTRELVVHKHYIVVYDLSGETIRILRVLHAAQRWPSGESR